MRRLRRWRQRQRQKLHKHAKNGGSLRHTVRESTAARFSTASLNKPINPRRWYIMPYEALSSINTTVMLFVLNTGRSRCISQATKQKCSKMKWTDTVKTKYYRDQAGKDYPTYNMKKDG
jgi:hypothetical protein